MKKKEKKEFKRTEKQEKLLDDRILEYVKVIPKGTMKGRMHKK